MKSINMYYEKPDDLKSFVARTWVENNASLLIQVFTAHANVKYIQDLLNNLSKLLPDAKIIGSTTDGEIMSGRISTNTTVISFTKFESTTVSTHIVKHKDNGFYSGQELANKLTTARTKLLISFADGIHTNGELFLSGINSVSSGVKVAGGLAGDNANFEESYIFNNDTILNSGAVAVALDSNSLKVDAHYSFNWHRIGKILTITKAEGNRVYTIDNKNAVDTYAHYLGESVRDALPAIGIEFPLIVVRNGIEIARAVTSKHEDGSLVFGGNLNEGDKVQFGYGNPSDILKSSQDIACKIAENSSEAIFIYSCMARRHFVQDAIEEESLTLNDIAPTTGFFTYGEFFTSSSPELLNQSLTLVSMSEGIDVALQKVIIKDQVNFVKNTSINALINLLHVTSEETIKQNVLLQVQNTFEDFYESSPDGILIVKDTHTTQCNRRIIEMFGYPTKETFLSLTLLDIIPKKQPDGSLSIAFMNKSMRTALKKDSHHMEVVCKKNNGERFWVEILSKQIEMNNDRLMYLIVRDISKRKAMELEILHQNDILEYKAFYDELTSVANRSSLMLELDRRINSQRNSKFALFFVDIDRFKNINDTLGHNIGDIMIRQIAQRLQGAMTEKDLLARLGGDEFLILVDIEQCISDISSRVIEILRLVDMPIRVKHYLLHVTASIGVSQYPVDGDKGDDLLKFADIAMYKAKDDGGNTYKLYDARMMNVTYKDIAMEKELRNALADDEFEVYYQPQVDTRTKKIVGVEALIRWNHPRLGLLGPDTFLGLVEKIGFGIELDLYVMRTAIREVSSWHNNGLFSGMLSLNITMKQLEYNELKKELSDTIEECDFKYENLEFEVTETEVMRNPEKIINILNELHNLGITLSIDDFGTGYSSLSHLSRLPIDKIKIDKSFIFELHDESTQIIVKTMILLAKSLNLDVIAEGVETAEQDDFLRGLGCNLVQGYYYFKPTSHENLFKILQDE